MSLEIKKLELSKKRIQLGVDELEFRVLEREEDIERIKSNINISKEKLEEVTLQIAELKGE